MKFLLPFFFAALGVAQAQSVTLAIDNSLVSLDPYDSNVTLDLSVAKSFYEGLYGFDAKLQVQPVLAQSHQLSADGLRYTFRLRSGVKFHDGTVFDAKAVKFVLDRVTNPDNRLKRYNLFSNIDSTTVVDARTVEVRLKRPFSAFLNQLAHPSAVMISPAALQKHGKRIGQNPVGTGPFRFVEWRQPDFVKAEKNPGYWQAGLPKVSELIWRSVSDSNTRMAMLQTGEAHFTAPLPYEQAAQIGAQPALVVGRGAGIYTHYVSMNTQRKPFNDVRVRRALNYAVNKLAMSKVVFAGFAEPATGPLPAGVDFAVAQPGYVHDLSKARALLKEAGYPNGFETELWASNNSVSAKATQFLQQQFAQVGVKVRITLLETGQRVQQLENIQSPEQAGVRLFFGGWSSSTGEADWGLRPLFAVNARPPKLLNFAYYANAEVDALLEEALATSDRAKKAAAYAKAQQRVHADAPWVFLVNRQVAYAHAKRLTGALQMPDGSFHFEQIALAP
jgi:glutathione transport system substrate-binding protein